MWLEQAIHNLVQGHGEILERIESRQIEIERKLHHFMSQITDWAAKEQADLTAISTTLDGVVTGIAALDTLITNLQNSGTLSASDQAALDAISAASTALVAKTQAISVAPPAAPVTPAP